MSPPTGLAQSAAGTGRPDAGDDRAAHTRPVRRQSHPGRWVSVAIVLLLAAMLVHALVTNPRFDWHVVGEFFAYDAILTGFQLTIELTFAAMAIGFALGVVLAVMKLSGNPIVSTASALYIWFFRGTPVLVQLIFWFNLAALFPTLSIGVPFGPHFVTFSANSVISPFTAALCGLGLNEGAYMAEIVRAGILSIDEGQTEAASSLGMSRMLTMRRIVLPQAMRVIIPPTGNELIGMLKTTSLVSVIALADLLFSAEEIYDRNYETIPLLIVACIWYLIATSVLSIGQYYVERHFARGSTRSVPLTPFQRVRRSMGTFRRRIMADAPDAGPGLGRRGVHS